MITKESAQEDKSCLILPRTIEFLTKFKELCQDGGNTDREVEYIFNHYPSEIARCLIMDFDINSPLDIRRVAKVLWDMCKTDEYRLWEQWCGDE